MHNPTQPCLHIATINTITTTIRSLCPLCPIFQSRPLFSSFVINLGLQRLLQRLLWHLGSAGAFDVTVTQCPHCHEYIASFNYDNTNGKQPKLYPEQYCKDIEVIPESVSRGRKLELMVQRGQVGRTPIFGSYARARKLHQRLVGWSECGEKNREEVRCGFVCIL